MGLEKTSDMHLTNANCWLHINYKVHSLVEIADWECSNQP
jgi:hypothetical protein